MMYWGGWMTDFFKTKFFQLFLVPNILFLVVALLTEASDFIFVLNMALLAISCGVCIAYHTVVTDMLFTRKSMTGSDWLALGIFCGWAAIIYFRIYSMTWRYLGQPDWLPNSDYATYPVFLSLCAAVFHLAAPGAIGEARVPTERWIRIGAWAAIGVFIALVLGFSADLIQPRTFK